MKSLTIEQIHSWRPCNMAAGEPYSRKNLRALFGGRDSIGILELLDLPIPPEDRLWCILRSEVLTDRQLRLLACLFAEHVQQHWIAKHPDDSRPAEAIRVARRFADGNATEAELKIAYAAAYAAFAAAAAVDADVAYRRKAAAAYAAFTAAAAVDADLAAYFAADAVGAAAAPTTLAAPSRTAEREWQVKAATEFIRGEIKR